MLQRITMSTAPDIWLFFSINRGLANPALDLVMPALSNHGFLLAFPVQVLAVLCLILPRSERGRLATVHALLICILPIAVFFAAEGMNDLLKGLFARPRPCQALEGVRLLVLCPRSFSLPSGHAMDSFAFAASFFFLTPTLLPRGWRWYMPVLAFLISLSRIYVGVHFPSDILLGALLGAGIGWAASVSVPGRFRQSGSDRSLPK